VVATGYQRNYLKGLKETQVATAPGSERLAALREQLAAFREQFVARRARFQMAKRQLTDGKASIPVTQTVSLR